MRLACLTACALLGAAAGPAAADEAAAKPASQHERFAACAHQSKGLHGEEHQRFMRDCLKSDAKPKPAHDAGPVATREGGQHNRMRDCNAEAREKSLHGDERRAFMSACLKS